MTMRALAEEALRVALRGVRALVLCTFAYAVILSGYLACREQPFFEPRLLALSAVDRWIPFWPWTVWVYGTVLYATLFAFFWLRERSELRRFMLTLVTGAALCWLGFALFPVTFPRHDFPTPPLVTATARQLADLRAADAPDNCLPSLHVALATMIALVLGEPGRARWLRWVAPAWAVLVALSTMTVKQHYAVDVLGGAVVGLAAYALCAWAARGRPYWASGDEPLQIDDAEGRAFVSALRKKVEAHQWSLDDLPLARDARPLTKPMVRLLNHVIYIEEIAARNFRFLRQAASDADVRELYRLFEDEEVRHAEALRRLLFAGGGKLERPGLGNALVLSQQRTLDPRSDADVALVTVSNPVFETFLDAGTIPFLQRHPLLAGPAFDELVARICKDEAAHIALNWFFSRRLARHSPRLRHLLNPAILRGMLAIPFMSLDVYALAHRLGYDFSTLLPSFRKLWANHRRFPELARVPLWWMFRLFVVVGVLVTMIVLSLAKLRILGVRLWTSLARLTDYLAWAVFGSRLLERHGLPRAG